MCLGAYLIKITVSNGDMKYDKVEAKHFISVGGLSGVNGTHFRWGAGIKIKPSGRLVLLATSSACLYRNPHQRQRHNGSGYDQSVDIGYGRQRDDRELIKPVN